MKKLTLALAAALSLGTAQAADYVIDSKGAHASINFKIQHLGYSWLTGRFNDFKGTFSYDDNAPTAAKIMVTIDTDSIDSNHAERDKHLKSDDFLNTDDYPEAKFVSTKVVDKGDGTMDVMGDFTLHGVTKPITIEAKKIGEGKDPWGGYRAGFEASTTIQRSDFGVSYFIPGVTDETELEVFIEGIRQ